MNIQSKKEAKKKLMFLKGEDFYYLTYNIIIILKALKCDNEGKQFKDFRKLAFLLDFVSDHNLINIIENKSNEYNINKLDRELLLKSYSNGMLRINQLSRLLYTLEQKGVVTLIRDPNNSGINLYLNKHSLIDSFWDKRLFTTELQNILTLKHHIKRLSVLKLDSLLEKLYDNHGLSRWAVY